MKYSTQPPHNPELNEAERRDCQVIWNLRREVQQDKMRRGGILETFRHTDIQKMLGKASWIAGEDPD